MKSSYNKPGRFVLVLLIYLFVFKFPLVCEGDVVDKESIEFLTESSPVDISNSKDNGGGASSSVLEEFALKESAGTASYTSNLIRLILSLVFVVFLAYVVVRFMKKSNLFVVNDDAYLRLVAQLNIEQGKSIKVFTLGDKAYIVGITSSSITKIAEIEDKVLIDAMNLKSSEIHKSETSSFNKVFSNFFPTAKSTIGNENKMFDDDFLKNQQERIKNINLKNE